MPIAGDGGGQYLKALCLEIGPERYAIEANRVVEVLRMPVITPLPECPIPAKGIFLYRTEVVPLVDEGVVFGIQADSKEGLKVAIIKGPEGLFGLEGRVEGVFEFETGLTEPPQTIPEKRRRFIKGLLKRAEKVYGLVDIDAFVIENLRILEV